MNFACESCQRRYTLPDEKVRGKVVKVRCKGCQSLISVGPLEGNSVFDMEPAAREPAGGLSPWEDEPTRAAPALDPSLAWFAMLKGQQVGPFDHDTLQKKVRNAELTLRSYVWREGMPDWQRAQELPELAPMFSGVRSSPPAAPALPPHMAEPPPEEVTRAVTSAELFAQAGMMPQPADELPTRVGIEATSPEPSAPPVPARPGAEKTLGGELFSDLDLTQTRAAEPAPEAAPAQTRPAAPEKAEDPFAQLAALEPDQLPPTHESTSFFIAKSGVNKRNPPWKIAAFMAIPLGLVLVFYALSEMHVVRPEVTVQDEEGREVTAPLLSPRGLSGLGQTLLGQKPPPPPPRRTPRKAAPPAAPAATASAPPTGTEGVDLVKGKRPQIVSPDLKALYEDADGKRDVGPSVRKPAVVQKDSSQPGGPPEESVAKVVGQTQPAFQFCIEQQLKKNPGFRGGKVSLVATVGSSGIVKKASINKPEIDTSDLGQCLKAKARRMSFPAFEGDDVDLDIPLILTTSM